MYTTTFDRLAEVIGRDTGMDKAEASSAVRHAMEKLGYDNIDPAAMSYDDARALHLDIVKPDSTMLESPEVRNVADMRKRLLEVQDETTMAENDVKKAVADDSCDFVEEAGYRFVAGAFLVNYCEEEEEKARERYVDSLIAAREAGATVADLMRVTGLYESDITNFTD